MNSNDPELSAMSTVFSALEGLEPAQRARVIRWTTDRFATTPAAKAGKPKTYAKRTVEAPEVSAAA